MRIFKKKPEKNSNDTANQQNNSESVPTISFDEGHPYFKNGTPILASEILKNEELQKKFSKLSTWLKKYPSTAGITLNGEFISLLKIYSFEKINLDTPYHEFRHMALKYQINQGFNLVLQFEKSVNKFKVEVGTAFTEPPFDDLSHLVEAHEYWQQARQQDFAMQLIKFEVNEIVLKKYVDLKQTTVHLVSLLAAIDAVPLFCIPYVSFSNLNISQEILIQSDNIAKKLEVLAGKYAQQSVQYIKKIDELRARFDTILNSTTNSPNDKNDPNQIKAEREMMQTQAFKQLLKKNYLTPSSNLAANLYDTQNHLLSVSADSSFFYDFVSHPKCTTYPLYKEFESKPSAETFKKLGLGIIEAFALKGDEATLVVYLCSLAFAQLMAPEVFCQIPDLKKSDADGKKEEAKNAKSSNLEKQKDEANPASNEAEAEKQPEAPKTDQQPEEPKTEQKQEETKVDQQSEEPKTEQKQEEQKIDQQPEEAKTEQKQEETKTEQKAEEAKTEQKAEEAKTEQKQEEAKTEQKAEETKTEQKQEEAKTEQKQEEAKTEQKQEEAKTEQKQEETKTEHPSEGNANSPSDVPPTQEEARKPEPSDADEEALHRMLNVGFDIFIAADPILTLRAISNNLNVECSTESSVKHIINCLKMVTPKWKEILKFAVDCSIQEHLPPKLRSVRYVVNQFVSV